MELYNLGTNYVHPIAFASHVMKSRTIMIFMMLMLSPYPLLSVDAS